MAKNKKKFFRGFLPEALLVIIAVLFFLFQFRDFSFIYNSVDLYLKPINSVDYRVITESRALNICGNWPIVGVELSPDRGNPFVIKNTNINPADTPLSALPGCYPFNQ